MTDLALAYDAMQGPDSADPACADRAAEPVLPGLAGGTAGLRIAVAGGYFQRGATPEMLAALHNVAQALGARRAVELAGAAEARAAAYVITATEGAALHLERLRADPGAFDPAVRDRLLAGALVPAVHVARAQKVRRQFQVQLRAVFAEVDVLLAPATPCCAPLLGQESFELDGVVVPVRANLGVFTQPISFVGLPVVAVPVSGPGLPLGVQVIAAPWREDVALRVAYALERSGVCAARQPEGWD